MRFLIVGASGFIGRKLLAHLRALGHEAVGTQAHSGQDGLIPFDLLTDRITERVGPRFFNQGEPVQAVICAGVTDMDKCLTDQELSYNVNVKKTIRLIDDLVELGAKPAFISTCFLFDGQRGYYNEEDPCSPINEYARHKAEVERYLAAHASNSFTVRLNKVVGDDPRETHLFTNWYKLISHDKPIVCVEGFLLSPTHVNDVAHGILLGCQKDLHGIYHLSNSEFFYRDELARLFCSLLGCPPSVIAKPLKEFNFPDTRALKSYLDGSKFARATGMAFTTMRQTIENFKRQLCQPS